MGYERPEPIEGVVPAAAAPVRRVLLTPTEREAQRRRREAARAARDQRPEPRPEGDERPPRLDIRG